MGPLPLSIALLALLIVGMIPRNSHAAGGVASKAACGAIPSTLSPTPTSSVADRYTIILRVNGLGDVDQYASWSDAAGGLRPRILDRDIFLINTRFEGSTAATDQAIATKLRHDFPCNRIFALNGESFNPISSRGYIYSLIDAPEVSAILMDWEQMDWPGPGPWVKAFKPNLRSLKSHLRSIGTVIRSAASASGKSFGVVPFFHKNWDHGVIGRTVQKENARVASRRQGFQSVQTQKYCPSVLEGLPDSIAPKIRTVLKEYKRASFNKSKHRAIRPALSPANLAFQVSFSADPKSTTPARPVTNVSPSEAATCTRSALAASAGAILYWAGPSDIAKMMTKPRICALRRCRAVPSQTSQNGRH